MTNHQTADFEHVLDGDGIRGVSYEPDDETVVVLVEEKLPESELADPELISNRVPDQRTDVVEVGDIEAQPSYEPNVENAETQGDDGHRGDQEPPIAGSSGCAASSTAATEGLLAEVSDARSAPPEWDGQLDVGTTVRISNAHVYGDSTDEYGADILQPSPMDGGGDDDAVGQLVGFVPLDDNWVDAAARTTEGEERGGCLNLAEEVTGVRREDYGDLKGETVSKAGRTTGVTTGEVVATGATVRVRYGDRTLTKRDQLVTRAMSAGGDSGSPVFEGEPGDPGAVVGQLFAGSDHVSVVNTAAHVEKRLGVELQVSDGQDHQPERTFEAYLEEQLVEEHGRDAVVRQHQFSNQRYADFLVFDEEHNQLEAWELENDSYSMVSGLGQALFYAQSALQDYPDYDGCRPVLCFPEGHIDEEERPLFERAGVTLREVDAPEDVSLEGV